MARHVPRGRGLLQKGLVPLIAMIIGTGIWAAPLAHASAEGGGADPGDPPQQPEMRGMAHETVHLADLSPERGKEEPPSNGEWPEEEEGGLDSIADPLEPVNRAFFEFNDRLYFWFLKPVGTGYQMIVPEAGRICIRNFFTNLIMPIRGVSCLLQGKFEGFGVELVRWMVNTTVGFLGFQDVAREAIGFEGQDEDLGQVLAYYGIGPGCFLNLPFLGPSSLTDTVGWIGGLYLNPLDYMVTDFWPNTGFRSFDLVNKTSLQIGEYEALKKAALDPYVAMRDAYHQYRLNQIQK